MGYRWKTKNIVPGYRWNVSPIKLPWVTDGISGTRISVVTDGTPFSHECLWLQTEHSIGLQKEYPVQTD